MLRFQLLLRLTPVLSGILIASSTLQAQQPLEAPLNIANEAATASLLTVSSDSVNEGADVIARFIAAETKTREVLNYFTFKREVILQTIGPDGNPTGEYTRLSEFVFDDRGNRVERITHHPPSTIRELRITKEDIQDLAEAQLLGIDIAQPAKYQLKYVGQEVLHSKQYSVIHVTPAQLPNPHRMKERYFVGDIWVEPNSFQIVRLRGTVEPSGKQRFPHFETWREPIIDALNFPTRTWADDVLSFPNRDVHFRIKVRYYDYKRFASKLTITEIDGPEK